MSRGSAAQEFAFDRRLRDVLVELPSDVACAGSVHVRGQRGPEPHVLSFSFRKEATAGAKAAAA